MKSLKYKLLIISLLITSSYIFANDKDSQTSSLKKEANLYSETESLVNNKLNGVDPIPPGSDADVNVWNGTWKITNITQVGSDSSKDFYLGETIKITNASLNDTSLTADFNWFSLCGSYDARTLEFNPVGKTLIITYLGNQDKEYHKYYADVSINSSNLSFINKYWKYKFVKMPYVTGYDAQIWNETWKVTNVTQTGRESSSSKDFYLGETIKITNASLNNTSLSADFTWFSLGGGYDARTLEFNPVGKTLIITYLGNQDKEYHKYYADVSINSSNLSFINKYWKYEFVKMPEVAGYDEQIWNETWKVLLKIFTWVKQ